MDKLLLQELKLVHFKNYEVARLTFNDKINCLVGNNGMGKTNLLDAIYYLCMGKSKFKLPDSAITQNSAAFFRLEGQFNIGLSKESIIAKVAPRKTKTFQRNHYVYQKLSEHIGLLPIVFVAPDDTELIKGEVRIEEGYWIMPYVKKVSPT